MKRFLFPLFLCQFVLASSIVLDLTDPNSFGTISDARFVQGERRAGSGNFIDFVEIHRDITEQGYNTSYRPYEFDEGSSANFNRDLQLSDLRVTNILGREYAVFYLDINERGNESLLSLDQLQIYVSSTGNRTGYPDLGTLVYDMDSLGDNTVLLDYSLAAGSGRSDMTFFFPTSLITDYALTDYVYLYSSFGSYGPEWTSSDGPEQWAINNSLSGYVPEPGTALLALSLSVLGLVRPYRKKI